MRRIARAAAITAAVGVWLIAVLALAGPAHAVQPEMVTICHAAGLDGTTHYVTLTLPYTAVYGQAGHFNEPGTPNAGHEDDYEGACIVEVTTTTLPEVTTTVPQETTTVPDVTTVPDPTTVPAGPTTTAVAPPVVPEGPAAGPTPLNSTPGSTLPFTGSSTLPLLLVGVALVASGGLAVWKKGRRELA